MFKMARGKTSRFPAYLVLILLLFLSQAIKPAPSYADGTFIAVNPLSPQSQPLDHLSRGEIFQIRRSRIAQYNLPAIFADDYTPDASIYGNIDDSAAWVHDTQFFVLNPYLLVLESGHNYVNAFLPYCGVPYVKYDGNSIRVNYSGQAARLWFHWVFDYYQDSKGFLRLWFVNAYDAGFRYVHVDMARSRNIGPLPGASEDSVTQGVYSGQEFYHLGHLGKNNISTDDPRAELQVLERDKETRIYVKLWKDRPSSAEVKEDLAYVIDVQPGTPEPACKQQENMPTNKNRIFPDSSGFSFYLSEFYPVQIAWLLSWIFFVPLVLAEACTTRYMLKLPMIRSLIIAGTANLISMLLGIQIAWPLALGGFFIDPLNSWQGPAIAIALCIPFYLAAVGIKYTVAASFSRPGETLNIKKWCWIVNLFTYLPLVGFFLCILQRRLY